MRKQYSARNQGLQLAWQNAGREAERILGVREHRSISLTMGSGARRHFAVGWTAFLISLLCHGAIFHLFQVNLPCPWVGNTKIHSAYPNTMPAYLMHSADILQSQHNTQNQGVLPQKSEKKEAVTDIPQENSQHAYALNTEHTGWKISAPPLQYPTMAHAKQQQGIVILQGTLNQKNGFDSIHILKSSGESELDEAAIQWFKKIKIVPTDAFFPKPGALFTQTVQFQLETKSD